MRDLRFRTRSCAVLLAMLVALGAAFVPGAVPEAGASGLRERSGPYGDGCYYEVDAEVGGSVVMICPTAEATWNLFLYHPHAWVYYGTTTTLEAGPQCFYDADGNSNQATCLNPDGSIYVYTMQSAQSGWGFYESILWVTLPEGIIMMTHIFYDLSVAGYLWDDGLFYGDLNTGEAWVTYNGQITSYQAPTVAGAQSQLQPSQSAGLTPGMETQWLGGTMMVFEEQARGTCTWLANDRVDWDYDNRIDSDDISAQCD